MFKYFIDLTVHWSMTHAVTGSTKSCFKNIMCYKQKKVLAVPEGWYIIEDWSDAFNSASKTYCLNEVPWKWTEKYAYIPLLIITF